ncbi:MAG: BREX-1 system adenine-specific DNA-methyltransferase PglX [Solirubrobacteraceae bacterium]
MNKDVRGRIQRTTQSARALLQREFAEQLEGLYDICADGTIADQPSAHLDEHGRLVREKLLAAVDHHAAGTSRGAEAVDGYLREAAFTTFNRFVALKLLEARGLIQECVSRGDQSSGFKEFVGLAPGTVQLEDHGYRIYLESIFDEIGQDVGALFDRRDPAGLLWPRRQAVKDLLAILNDRGLLEAWNEDETIGWVYQYFNSADERKTMRDESQAPRSSRELAVRNQFFTPRYVVQFLTDNTLGRLWLEMQGEKTALAKRCEYLVRSTDEHSPPRPRKDPRDLRILDPACGSGHFLLYSFDLLLAIYDEAWEDERFAVQSQATGRTLHQDYPDLNALRRAAPALIVEHNLHGVEIDPRCAQIAAFALWLRAQRAWKDASMLASERPSLRHTNIVVAEPIPGDGVLAVEFAGRLDPPLLGELFKKIVQEMRLAGELGTLLRAEDGIAAELSRAREQFVKQQQAPTFLPGLEPVRDQGELDLSGIDDDAFFHEAEARILEALRGFAETATGGAGVRRRLFAGDAAQGVALIELLRTRFDVILMNPPFGQGTERTYDYVRSRYAGAHSDILAAFVRRGTELAPDGFLGAITSRSFLLTPRLQVFRERDVIPSLALLADLGLGVMDDAYVESAAYVLGKASSETFVALDCRTARAVDPKLLSPGRFLESGLTVKRDTIRQLPQSKLLYSLPLEVVRALGTSQQFEPTAGTAREGMKSFQNERFIRLAWEVTPTDMGRVGRWRWFTKGGSHAFLYAPIHLLLNWDCDGAELRAVNEELNGSTAQVRQASTYWYRAGITYSKRSARGFSARCMPQDVIFSSNGPAVLPNDGVSATALLGWINSRFIRALLQLQSNFGDFSTGAIKRLPWRDVGLARAELEVATLQTTAEAIRLDSKSETSPYFVLPYVGPLTSPDVQGVVQQYAEVESNQTALMVRWDAEVARAYESGDPSWIDDVLSFGDGDEAEVDQGQGGDAAIADDDSGGMTVDTRRLAADMVSWAAGVAFGRFDVRLATGARALPGEPDPFDPLPVCSPGMLTGEDGLPRASAPAGYPLAFPEDGILVDDPGDPRDLTAAVRAVFEVVFGARADAIWEEAAALLVPKDQSLRAWLASGLFEHHLKLHSKSRRRAPVLWQLGVPSGRYSVWLYAHRLTADSIFQLQNEVVAPKLVHEERRLTSLVQSSSNSPSAKERKEIAAQETLVGELRGLLEEIKGVAPLWNPSLDDGIVFAMSPLWPLVPLHKPWQKELKSKWDELAAGKYDWAHIAMRLWPERVVPKCATDRSFAIAHGLEDTFWVEGGDGKWEPRAVPTQSVEDLIDERSSTAIQAALKTSLGRPAVPTRGRRRAGVV